MKLLTLLALPVLLFSCSSVHKAYSKNATSTDSSAVTHSEVMASSAHDSSNVYAFDNKYKIYTEYVYDTVPTFIQMAGKTDTVYKYIPRKMRSYEEGTQKGSGGSNYTNKDTSYATADANTHVKDTSKVISKDKTSSRMPIGFWISFALVAAITIAAFWLTKKVKKAGDIAQDVADVANGLSNKA